jgi:hypothetical protein
VRLAELRTRLEESRVVMPDSWVEEHGWNDGVEVETVGIADGIIARRAMDLMLELQRFLDLEFPVGQSGYSEKDCE